MTKKEVGTNTTTYSYDLSGVLRSATLPTSGDSVTYYLDGLNRRVGRELVWGSSTTNQYFLYDDQYRVAAEMSSGGTLKSVFVYGTKSNVPDYMWQPSGTTYRIISDWLGSVRLVVNASNGLVVQQLDYDEFGNVVYSYDANCPTGMPCFPTQPFGFAGGLQDVNTGLVRFGARDYDPQLGRWASKDPIRFKGGQTNLYVYSGNDPVNRTDMNGKDPDPVCATQCVAQAQDAQSNCLAGFLVGSIGSRLCGRLGPAATQCYAAIELAVATCAASALGNELYCLSQCSSWQPEFPDPSPGPEPNTCWDTGVGF